MVSVGPYGCIMWARVACGPIRFQIYPYGCLPLYVLIICLFIVVVCGSIWFHKVVYSQIWFHLVLMAAYCGLKLHLVANGSLLGHNVSCCMYMFLYCNIVAYYFTLFNIVANSDCRRSFHGSLLPICVFLMWIHMIASRQYNAILNLV